jgi:hypothetical protein
MNKGTPNDEFMRSIEMSAFMEAWGRDPGSIRYILMYIYKCIYINVYVLLYLCEHVPHEYVYICTHMYIYDIICIYGSLGKRSGIHQV